MISFRLPQAKTEGFRKRINRAHSPVIALSVPWLTVMAASIIPAWLTIASAPIVPPFGFLVLLAWRQLRPGLMPIWGGLPLGAVDDLYSGQPFGSAILLWSLAMIALDMIEARIPWRNFVLEWLVAAGLIVAYIIFSLAAANAAGASTPIHSVVPQILLSVLLYPLIGRIVAAFDRFRLLPFRVIA